MTEKNESKAPVADSIMNQVMASLNPEHLDGVDRKRKAKLVYALDKTARKTNTADLGASLRALCLSEQGFFDELTYEVENKFSNDEAGKRAGKYMREVYESFNKTDGAGKNAFQRANIDSDSGAGGDDFSSLFVEKTIKKRVEGKTEILQVTDNKRLKGTNNKFPKSSNVAKSAFAASAAALADLTATIDGGFDNTQVEAQKFGATMALEQDTFAKLDPQIVAQILEELSIADARGRRDQIYNGAGTGVTSTGMFTGATAVTFDGNITQTLIKMIAAIADTTRGGSKDIFILTNTAGMITLEGEKFINKSYDDLLDVLGGKKFLERFRIIEDNVILTTGSSPDKAVPLLVGKASDYLVGTQTDPRIMVDQYSGFTAGTEVTRIMSFWGGIPHFADSFAKTVIPGLY